MLFIVSLTGSQMTVMTSLSLAYYLLHLSSLFYSDREACCRLPFRGKLSVPWRICNLILATKVLISHLAEHCQPSRASPQRALSCWCWVLSVSWEARALHFVTWQVKIPWTRRSRSAGWGNCSQSLISDALSPLKVTEGQSFLICSKGGKIKWTVLSKQMSLAKMKIGHCPFILLVRPWI